MKKVVLLLLVVIFGSSCKDNQFTPPKNKIDKETMINIMYDMAVLEAARTQSYATQVKYPTTVQFVKEKYKIDSLTLVENTKFYAADLKGFKKMYEEVRNRLEESRKAAGDVVNSNPVNATEGVVK
jgi:hypothetical protein